MFFLFICLSDCQNIFVLVSKSDILFVFLSFSILVNCFAPHGQYVLVMHNKGSHYIITFGLSFKASPIFIYSEIATIYNSHQPAY